MIAPAAAMDGVDADVEARKLRLRSLKEEHARRNGVAHPDKAPLDRETLDAAMPEGMGAASRKEAADRKAAAPWEQRVLDAAAKLYRPGEPAYPARLADELGLKPVRVSIAIGSLKKKALWPYAGCGPGRNSSVRAATKARINGEPTTRTRQQSNPARAAVVPTSTIEPDLRAPDPDVIHNADPKADAELLVIQRILSQLTRLPTDRARRRVLALLADRAEEETEAGS